MNQFGHNFRLAIWGESHGHQIGISLDGVPAGIPLSEEDFAEDLARRRSGAPGTTPRSEPDVPQIVSGVYDGYTTGAPLTIEFANTNTHSQDYSTVMRHYRPSHADLVAYHKFAGFNDPRGGGHFSARLTVALVAAGVVAKKMLPASIRFATRLTEIGGCTDPERFNEVLHAAAADRDSVGGIVECRVQGVPLGLGQPFFDSAESMIAHLLFAVPAALVAIRAYYVIFNLDLYRRGDGSLDWGAILRYSDGGLAIYGAIISSVIVLLIFCKVRKVSFLAFADLGVHGLFIGQLIGRWGNFMNVEAFGSTTTLPWRMCGTSIAEYLLQSGYVDQAGYEAVLSGALGVHPTFFYESMWNLAGLFLVYQIGKRWRKYDGECFLFYLCWYGLGRAWIEGLRTDSLYFFGLELFGMPIRVSQMVAVVCFLAAGALLLYQRSRPHPPAQLYVNQLRRQKDDQKTETEEE